jgi:hypothetical protein
MDRCRYPKLRAIAASRGADRVVNRVVYPRARRSWVWKTVGIAARAERILLLSIPALVFGLGPVGWCTAVLTVVVLAFVSDHRDPTRVPPRGGARSTVAGTKTRNVARAAEKCKGH